MNNMNNRLFSLPENILRDIYTMDSTYRDKIRNEIKEEIFKRSWTTFRREFLTQSIFNNEHIVIRKLDLLLKYLQNTWVSLSLIPSSDIIISTSWKIMTYDNYHIDYNDDYLYEDDVLVEEPIQFIVGIRGHPHTVIEGVIYTLDQYRYNQYRYIPQSPYSSPDYDDDDDSNPNEIDIYQNHEFKIVQCLR